MLIDSYDYTSPTYKQFLADMKAAGYTDPALISDGAASWLATKIFADEATKRRPRIGRAAGSVAGRNRLRHQGMLQDPHYTARKPTRHLLGAGAERHPPYAIGATVKNGKSTPITGEWQGVRRSGVDRGPVAT